MANEPSHGDLMGELVGVRRQTETIGARLAVLEAAAAEQRGAIKVAKWAIAFLIAIGMLVAAFLGVDRK